MHGFELQAQGARGAVTNGAAAVAAQQSSQPSAVDSLTNGAHPSQAEPDTASGAQQLASPPDSSAAAAPAANGNGEQVKCCVCNGFDMVQSICRLR